MASGVALLAVALVLITVYRESSLDSMVETVAAENVAMSRAFANVIWPGFARYVTDTAPSDGDALKLWPETDAIHKVAKSLVAGLNVVKIYRLDGFTIYSSDFADK